jgi:arginase
MSICNISIVEIPSEVGCAFQGASLGSQAIRIAANQKGSDFFVRHPNITIPDRNSILSRHNWVDICPYAKRSRYVLENCQIVCNTIEELLRDNRFPVILSADHSSAIGILAGIAQAYANERLGVIWIDAHSDMHSPYTTYSGNFHGMSLGAALGLDQEGRTLIGKQPNILPQLTQQQWEYFKAMGGAIPWVQPEDLALIGVRFFKPEHSAIIESLSVSLYRVEDVHKCGALAVAKAVQDQLQKCDRILISFDVDSLDCDQVSRGTGTPEPNGLYLEEVKVLLKYLMANSKVTGFEVTEINPLLDERGNAMAEAAWDVLSYVLS